MGNAIKEYNDLQLKCYPWAIYDIKSCADEYCSIVFRSKKYSSLQNFRRQGRVLKTLGNLLERDVKKHIADKTPYFQEMLEFV